MVGILLAFSVGYGVLFNLGGAAGEMGEDMLLYAVVFQCVLPMVGSMAYTGYLSVVLSLGSGRREAVAGYQFKNFVQIFLGCIVVLVIWIWTYGAETVRTPLLLVLLETSVFLCAVGQIGGALVLKFGTKGYIAAIAVTMVAAVAMGVLMGMKMSDDDGWWFSMIQTLSDGVVLAAGFAAAAVCYALSVLLLDYMLKNHEVRLS